MTETTHPIKPVSTSPDTDAVQSARTTLTTEADGLRLLQKGIDDQFAQAVELIAARQANGGRVIVSGMGKSGHIARKIAATLASTGTTAYFVHPAEASHGDLGMITREDVLLVLSFSGTTRELRSVLDYAIRFQIPIIAITKMPQSLLGRAAHTILPLPNAAEACPNGLAPTTSTLMQLALGDALAIALLQQKGFSKSDFKKFHPRGKLGAALTTVQEIMHQDAKLPITQDIALTEAIPLIDLYGFGCLGIVDSAGDLCGIITDGDLRRHVLKGDLLKMNARDVMTTTPKYIVPDCPASEAINIMEHNKIQCLFVCTGKTPCGIISMLDLVRHGA